MAFEVVLASGRRCLDGTTALDISSPAALRLARGIIAFVGVFGGMVQLYNLATHTRPFSFTSVACFVKYENDKLIELFRGNNNNSLYASHPF